VKWLKKKVQRLKISCGFVVVQKEKKKKRKKKKVLNTCKRLVEKGTLRRM
jgi:hypothetical protein